MNSTLFQTQADQICYSVLCVFSYVAAGQDNKKNPVVITPQIQDIHAQQRQQFSKQQQQQQQQDQTKKQLPASPKKSLTHRSIHMQSPPITTTIVQPQEQLPTKTMAIPTTTITSITTSQPKNTQLPQLPPRTPSLTTTDTPVSNTVTTSTSKARTAAPPGPPPAIPPRSGAISRSGSVQSSPTLSHSGAFAGARNFMRTISVNTAPPQFKPQPPPAFVIPKRRTNTPPMTSESTPITNRAPTAGNVQDTTTNQKH